MLKILDEYLSFKSGIYIQCQISISVQLTEICIDGIFVMIGDLNLKYPIEATITIRLIKVKLNELCG
jgi:hypothetical protein